MGNSEARRYQQIRNPIRQQQFLLGRALLRSQLSEAAGKPVWHWQIEEQPGLPPRIINAQDCHFSISHSGPWVACVFTTAGRIGLDIERHTRPRDVLALAEFAFHTDELSWLQSLNAEDRLRAFYWLWTAKEAWIKYDRAAATPSELHQRRIIDRWGNPAVTMLQLRQAIEGEVTLTLASKVLPDTIQIDVINSETTLRDIALARYKHPSFSDP